MAAAENGASQASTSSPLESRALSYIQDAEKCAEAVLEMFNLVKFNSEQCMYLCDKLRVVIESASSSLTAVGGHEVGTDFVRNFELLMVLGKQIESFVEGCCQDNWIQAAAVSFNMSWRVSSLGFHLELCNVAFLDEDEASMDDVDSMNKSAAELVKQKASVDAESLRFKVVEALDSLSGEDRDLANYLLERLSGMRRISSSGSGNLFARLKPEKQVGRGASASVYEAMWLGTRVAMKTFEGSENEGFEKEVEILSRLCHPNITSVFCSTKDTRSCSIVMELMDGDLYQLINERMRSSDSAPFPILEAVDIMLQIGEGVKYLHDQGIVHRDLKSGNILYKAMQVEDAGSRCAHVKVADFGISKARDTNTTFSELTRNTGTTRWMPPEVIGLSGKNQRHKPKYPFKLDSYSFGLVCYEVLVGRLPFSEYNNPKELKESILNKERPQLPCEPRECPPILKDLIEKCWSHEPKQRPTFGDVCRGLKYIKYLLMTERWMKHGEMIAERKREGGTAHRGGKTAGWGAKTAVMGLLTRFSAPNWRGLKLNLNKSTSRSRPLIFDPKITSGMLKFLFEGDSLVGCTLLGEGWNGKVYKVPLQDDLVVAIRRVRIETSEDDYDSKQIRTELETLGFIRHRNMVQLLAYIFKPDSHLLIYEYVPGGSLQDALHRMALGTLSLSWPVRHRILCGVAQGLVYLHNVSLGSFIVHRGIKPANILLDEDAKLSDFGLAAIVPLEATHNSTDVLVGTIGFIAPEYCQTMRYSQKSDVFSFGVVIAQLLTARNPTDQFVVENGGSIGQWLLKCLQDSNAAADAIDPALRGSNVYEAEILLAMKVAVFCTNQDPQHRPSSTEVLKMLLRIRNPEPRTPRGDNQSWIARGATLPS